MTRVTVKLRVGGNRPDTRPHTKGDAVSNRLHQIPAALATAASHAWPALLIMVVLFAVT